MENTTEKFDITVFPAQGGGVTVLIAGISRR